MMTEGGSLELGDTVPRRMSRRRLLHLLAATASVSAGAALLTACRVAAGAAPSASATSTVAGANVGSVATPSLPARAAIQGLRIPLGEPGHIDPNLASSGEEVVVAMALYDGMLTFDSGGNPVPLCAERWDVSPDGLTYTFHLRGGMRWTDGHPVTAGDFAYSWKRLADPALGSEYAAASYVLKGAQDFNEGKSKDAGTIGVAAVDSQTLTATLAQPAAYFLHVAATWSYLPVPQWAVEAHGAKWVEPGNSVSNGPFKLDSWQHDQRLTLARNNTYYGAKPSLTTVSFAITADVTTSLPAFENNELDVTGQILPAQIDGVRGNAALATQLHTWPASSTTILFFDCGHTASPVSNAHVRRALYLAIDQSKIVNDAYKGLFLPAPSVTPEGIAGYNPAAAPRGGLDAARQELAAAGYPGGKGLPGLTLIWAQNPSDDLLGQILQQMWKTGLGIDATLKPMEGKSFRAFFDSLATPTSHYDGYIWGWSSDYEDPHDWDNILWESDQDFFHTRWKNVQFDTLVMAADRELDARKRAAMYEQAEVILMTDMPVIPLYHGATTYLVKPWVMGFQFPRALATRFLQDVWIAAH